MRSAVSWARRASNRSASRWSRPLPRQAAGKHDSRSAARARSADAPPSTPRQACLDPPPPAFPLARLEPVDGSAASLQALPSPQSNPSPEFHPFPIAPPMPSPAFRLSTLETTLRNRAAAPAWLRSDRRSSKTSSSRLLGNAGPRPTTKIAARAPPTHCSRGDGSLPQAAVVPCLRAIHPIVGEHARFGRRRHRNQDLPPRPSSLSAARPAELRRVDHQGGEGITGAVLGDILEEVRRGEAMLTRLRVAQPEGA